MSKEYDFSFVIPALNEEESIEILYGEIVDCMNKIGGTFEIVWVDDGSTDGTHDAMKRTEKAGKNVHIVRLGRNMGKSEAYSRGFAYCSGDLVVTLDADLQDDPAELHKLLDVLDDKFDLVVGRKMGRLGNEPRKTLASYPFNWMLRTLIGVNLHDTNSGFRVMRRDVAKSLELYGDLYRFIPQISFLNGFLVTETGVIHRKRTFGKSKYGISRFWTGLLDLMTIAFLGLYVKKPLHLFATFGALCAFLGISLEVYVLISKLMGGTFQQHVAAIVIGAMLITLSVQLFMSGILADMLAAQHRMIQTLKKSIEETK